MKKINSQLCIVVILVGTVAAAAMHGTMTNRWGIQPDHTAAENLLRQSLPKEVGNWREKGKDGELDKDVTDMLECRAYIKRVYENVQTGDRVSVGVLLGPAGPISAHTPEICYSSNDYEIDGEKQKKDLVDKNGMQHSLWQVKIRSNDQGRARDQQVYYGWSTGGCWEATERPRFAYGGAPYLYKIQLAGPIAPNVESAKTFDPNIDFLTEFLAQCQTRLIVPKKN